MTNEESTKFQSKMDISVEEHFRATSSKLVSLVHELVQTLGKDKAYEIVSFRSFTHCLSKTLTSSKF